MECGSASGGVWNVVLRVEVCGMWLCEWRCVECGSESGVVWYIVIRLLSIVLFVMEVFGAHQ